MRRGETRPLGEVTGDALRRLDPQGRRFGSRAVEAWHKAVGERISSHTRGCALRDGELLVYVDSPAWANELALMGEQMRVRVNAELGQELVRSLRFSVSRKVSEEASREAAEAQVEEAYRPDETERVPLTEAERSQVEYASQAIDDPELREAAVRAMTADLELKKGALKKPRKRRQNDVF